MIISIILWKEPCWWQFSIQTSLLNPLRLQLSLTSIHLISTFAIHEILWQCFIGIVISYICILYLVLYRIHLSLHRILNCFTRYLHTVWVIYIKVLCWICVWCIKWNWTEVVCCNVSFFIEWEVFTFDEVHFLLRVYFSLTLCYHGWLKKIIIALIIVGCWWHFSVRFELVRRALQICSLSNSMCIELSSRTFCRILSNFIISWGFNTLGLRWWKLCLTIVEPLDVMCVCWSRWLWVEIAHFALCKVVHSWLVKHGSCILVLCRWWRKHFVVSISLHGPTLFKYHSILFRCWYTFLVVFINNFILVSHNKLFLLKSLCWC